MDPFKTLTVKEAAKVTNLPIQSVYRAIYKEGLPAVRIGAAVRVREKDLLTWLDEHTGVSGIGERTEVAA